VFDVAVGMIMEAVQRAAVADNTVIIFTSDNGYFCGSHGYGSKVLPYEEGSRVPLIIFDPRHVNSGKSIRCQELTGSIDFAPTILDLAGVRIPRKLDGRSLLPLYDQPQKPIHESLQLINVWGPVACHSFAVMTKQHKYIYWPWEKDNFKPAEEIYDIPSDPLELVNIAELPLREANIPVLNQMRKIYAEAVGDWTTKAFHKHGYTEYRGC
jgi:arylsulfatase A-like enzyme